MIIEGDPTANKQVDLEEKFLMYIGPINATAIHTRGVNGGRIARDQHSVVFSHAEHPDIDVWEQGTLKVYCPAVLLAFSEGESLKRLNGILNKAEPFLYEDIPFLDAVRKGSSADFDFVNGRLDFYVRINTESANLAADALGVNFKAYDRSIILQRLFMEENDKLGIDQADIYSQAVIAFARQKAIFIALAPHYAVEAVFDDQFTDFPYHLPDFVNALVTKNAPLAIWDDFNRGMYERGLFNSVINAPSPDAYRFDPILASLIAPYVLKTDGVFDHYNGWDDFFTRVIARVNDPVTIRAFEMFAKSMRIPLEYAFFAAYKMCQKEIRKRGRKHLYDEVSAQERARQIEEAFNRDLEYFRTQDPYLRLEYYESTEGGFGFAVSQDQIDGSSRLSKRDFQAYRRALVQRANIDYVNSVIGTYKFVPWEKSDLNFQGTFLPYSIMKSEKARITRVLLDPQFGPFWKPEGYWFRDILPQLMDSHPSMYSKWFFPLLEKGMVDARLIQEASSVAAKYLEYLLQEEQKIKS